MDKGLIVLRSLGALRKAAIEGQAYYSCERFEDRYGRLVVGIGARLDGNILRAVAKLGRQSVYVSAVALYDGKRFQHIWEKTQNPVVNARDGIEEMYQAFARVHPYAAKKIAALNPQPSDLEHGVRVGYYVRRLMQAYNGIQKADAYHFSPKDMMSGFVAGVVHDIGRWQGLGVTEHAKRGAGFLRKLVVGSKWMQTLAYGVEHHHVNVSACVGDQVFLVLPLVLAERVVEGESLDVDGWVAECVNDQMKDLLICLCNLEHIIPPLAVVRLCLGEGGVKHELAVRLRYDKGRGDEIYLLRFAQVDARGRPRPMPLEHQCLIGRGHPDYEGQKRVVVDLLSECVYERLFSDYEGLIPVYQRLLLTEGVSVSV